MKRIALLICSHALALATGLAAGVYLLPILTAPAGPDPVEVAALANRALYTGEFRRDLQDSDALHWGEGRVSVGPRSISLQGKLAPGPDYKLYLIRGFVETERDFLRLKPQALQVGSIKTFDGFVVPVPASVDVSDYDSVVVWCERFSQFITSARYR